MRKINRRARASAVPIALGLAGGFAVAAPAQAAEYGFGDYLLGYSIPLIGYTPLAFPL